MSEVDGPKSSPPPTVFLSYASADRAAARSLKDAMIALGLEVWYDESDLGGGELWDQKIRGQIRECDYFMPLISAQTEARHEGYFRREWRLAVERTLDMADDHAFLLPVVIDDTGQTGARVPEKFLAVQWLKVPAGHSTPALEGLCRRLIDGESAPPMAPARSARPPRSSSAHPPGIPAKYPDFPSEAPGQKARFWFEIMGWALKSAWIFFNQLPRWVRIIVYVWLSIALLSKGCSTARHESREMSPADTEKLRAISDAYHGSKDKGDIKNLAAQIARITQAVETPAEKSPMLAIPFAAPGGDAAAAKLADSAFAQVYGKVIMSHRDGVGLSKEAAPCSDLTAALNQGRSNHSQYVLCGTVLAQGQQQALTVKIASVADGSTTWSKTYPVVGADPAQIAAEVEAHIPKLEDDD